MRALWACMEKTELAQVEPAIAGELCGCGPV